MNTFKLIFKSFSKPKKFFVYFSLLISFSIAFLSFLNTYSQISYQMRCSDTLYGDYTNSVVGYSDDYNVFLEKLSESSKTEYIYPFCCMESREKLNETTIYLYCVDNNFWEHTEYELIEGNYPSSKHEVVCERSYLYHLGYTREQMIGAEISLLGQNYRVSGIYTKNLLYVDNLPKHIVFTAYNGNPNSFIFKVKDSFFEDPLLKNGSYNVNMQTNFNNSIQVAERSKSTLFHSVVFIVLLICSAFIFNHIIALIMRKHKNSMAIYDLIGISRKKIWCAFFAKIVLSILSGILVGTLLYGISLYGVVIIYNKICGLNTKEITDIISFKPIISGALLFTGMILLIVLIRSALMILGKKNVNNETGISNSAKIKKIVSRVTSSIISARHFRLSIFSNITSIVVISLIIAAFSTTNIFLNYSKDTFQPYKGYDYLITPVTDFTNYFYSNYSLDDFLHIENQDTLSSEETDKAMSQATDDLLKFYNDYQENYIQIQREEINDLTDLSSDGFDIKKVYTHIINDELKSSFISESLLQYLKDYTDAYKSILMGKEKIPVNIMITVLSDDELKKIYPNTNKNDITLKNNQCIAFNNYTTILDEDTQLLFNTNDIIELSSGKLTVSDVKKKYINNSVPNEECVVLGVNIDTFIQLTGKDIPDNILIKVPDTSKEKFEKNINLTDFLEITNLNESIQHDKIEKGQDILYIIGIIFLLILSVFSCIFTIYMRCLIFEKEYATMNVIGIPSAFTRSIIIKELTYIILPVIVTSLAAFLGVFFYIENLDSGDTETKFPIFSWCGSCVCVVLIGIICAAILIRKFDNYAILKNKE